VDVLAEWCARAQVQQMATSSRWAYVVRWQLAGMLVTLFVPAVVRVAQAMLAREPLMPTIRALPGELVFLAAIVMLMAPLSLLVLWAFSAWLARVPAAGATAFARLLSSLGLACALALLAGLVSQWELVLPFAGLAVFVREVVSVSAAVLPWSVLGVVGGGVITELFTSARRDRAVDVAV